MKTTMNTPGVRLLQSLKKKKSIQIVGVVEREQR